MIYRVTGAALALLAAACGGRSAPPESASLPTDWRRTATEADRARLRGWRDVWMTAMGRARATGNARAIAAQGALFAADGSLARPVPPAGDYRCRVFKLGGARDYAAYPAFTCRIDDEGDVASFHKTSGSQRPVGLIFGDPAGRGVFLGTLMLADEARPIDYGRDASRDMAGFVDRIGERRWRIVLPRPRFDSMLDVIELRPAT